MIDETTLSEIKKRLLITGEYQDSAVLAWANDTLGYIRRAGVKEDVAGDNDERLLGALAKGVYDMWTADSLSPIFYDMVTQLALSLTEES